ncbi:MAG TPA: NUDIX domain-containing protein [Gemmatimonadales bacterium]|jgi:8-oxo-dGTP pyrophosphatase MutT (NUDIX family)
MTNSRVTYVDIYVMRGRGDALEVLLLRRARDQARGGTWEGVHGKIDDGETPVAAARRELQEEIGCAPIVLYNLSRVEQFYLHANDQVVLIPVFVAFVAPDAIIQLSAEHDTLLWLTPAGARDQCTWPRAARAIDDAVRLLGDGNAGLLEDVLRVG